MDKEDLIKKWLSDELTSAEKEIFEQEEDFSMHKRIIDSAQQFKASNVSQPEVFNDFQLAYKSKTTVSKNKLWFKPFIRIASVLIIALGLYFAFIYDDTTHIQTLVKQHTTFQLPDASQVTLNADSQVDYKKSNWDDKRRIILEGEAYFKVAKGNTFDVVTSQGTVTVVGTEFNVKQRPNYFEVQCFEGTVRVTANTISKTLLAGDIYRLLNNEFSQDKTAALRPHWTQHKSTFKAIPLKAVFAEMERQYDVEIRVENVNAQRLFTGGFMHDNIENALLSVTQPMDLTYTINASNDVVIHDSKK